MAIVNCDNIRKIVIRQIEKDGSENVVVKYIDISTNQEIAIGAVRHCANIQTIQVSCATICNN